MSLFAHYPASPGTVRAQSDALMTGSRGVQGVGSSVSGRTSLASSQTDGLIQAPILGVDRPITTDAQQLSTAGLVASGALGLFAGAITTYNEGVDELNRIYDEAKAANFHAEPVAADATGADGEPLSDTERQNAFDGRVTSARTALEATLRTREAGLMRTLDDAADGTAGLLSAGPESPIFQLVLSLFGGGASPFAGASTSGSATVSDDDGDDDGGGLLGDVMGGLSDLGGGVSNFFGGGMPGVGAVPAFIPSPINLLPVAEEVWDRGSTLGVYAWDTGVRRLTNPAQTIWDTVTGTTLLEDAAAVEGIVGEDGELYREGPFADDAAILTGVSVPPGSDAITLGHTVRVGDEGAPPPDLVAHEMQHVYDLEDMGGSGFYGSYLAEYLMNRASGDSDDEAYRNISWEQRAYHVGDNYPGEQPEGIGGPVSDVIDWVDGLAPPW